MRRAAAHDLSSLPPGVQHDIKWATSVTGPLTRVRIAVMLTVPVASTGLEGPPSGPNSLSRTKETRAADRFRYARQRGMRLTRGIFGDHVPFSGPVAMSKVEIAIYDPPPGAEGLPWIVLIRVDGDPHVEYADNREDAERKERQVRERMSRGDRFFA